MSKKTFSVAYEICNVNTNETIDRKSMDLEVTDMQIRELAKVMEENGGFAPELSVFQNLYEYLIDECINYYQAYFAPDDDEFWEKNTIEFGDKLPEELLQEAEKYVRHRDMIINYYYEDNGENKTGNAFVHMPSAIYWTMVEATKTKPSEKDDFDHLKDTCPIMYDEVRQLVAQKTEDGKTNFILKEFPYQVLEQAMISLVP